MLHAAACGAHADTKALARIFLALAVMQGAVAVAGFVRSGRAAAVALVAVNLAAAGGWLLTRFTGLSDIPGLEVAEQPGLADTAAAILALVAALTALTTMLDLAPANPRRGLASASVVVAALVIPGMFDITNHDHGGHSHDEAAPGDGHSHATDNHSHDGPATDAVAVAHSHDEPAEATPNGAAANHSHDDGTAGDDHGHDTAGDGHSHAVTADPVAATGEPEPPAWPRPWDPSQPIDFSGVPGVTTDQQARAEQLVVDTMRDLPAFADVTSLEALGYRSIGDAGTGFEHFINFSMLGDDKVLDPTAPESLVFQVGDIADTTDRTLVSAMYIAQATSLDDPAIADFAGPLMQWHNHTNLCWGSSATGDFVVRGVTDEAGNCPPDTVNTGGQFPMVHVWIAPHECGPFAALEGHGAGQAGEISSAERVDLCAGHDHGAGHGTDHGHGATVVAMPYDPTKPINLGGIDGVTLEQQAFAENLVADTVRNLPQWADPAVAEAAGFHSILDGGTGHEHYIQWDWIDDDVWLNPHYPESLVYEPQPDGSKQLVSAMFMLPNGTDLADVPDWGGPLMQWHVHGDLCFTADPVAPSVAGTKPIGGTCQPPLVDLGLSPMIHVWITPNPCGPFAALEGIGAGQVEAGDEHFCNSAHGSH